MTNGHHPVGTTLLAGAVGALAWLAGAAVPAWPGAPSLIRLTFIWLLTAGYALLLARWGRRPLSAVFFPLIVLGLWGWQLPPGRGGILMALTTLAWVRSGVCFPVPFGRALIREILLCGGGGWLAVAPASGSTFSWALGIWLFFLVQTLFFVVGKAEGEEIAVEDGERSFERARRKAERILSQNGY